MLAAASPGFDVAVRVDPIVFVLGGWSLGLDVQPAAGRSRASLAIFHVEVPAPLVPLVAAPAAGVRVIEDAVQLAVRTPLGERGAWLGPEVFVYRLTYLRAGQRAVAHEAYAHLSAGWRIFPLPQVPIVERVFVEPWLTVGLPVFHSGGAVVGGGFIGDRGLNWHATVSIGAQLGAP